MPRGKQETAEQITPKLRVVEVAVARGKTVAESVKRLGGPSRRLTTGRRSMTAFASTEALPVRA